VLDRSTEKSNVTSGTCVIQQKEFKENHYKKLRGFSHHMWLSKAKLLCFVFCQP